MTRYIRIALSLIFAFLAASAWWQSANTLRGPTDGPIILMVWQAAVGACGAAAAWGSFKATGWSPVAALAYGVVTASMIIALGPILDLEAAAMKGLWLGAAVILAFGLASALFLRRLARRPLQSESAT